MDKENNSHGKVLILTGEVVCNEEDEDLKLFNECCKHVCNMYLQIEKDKENG